MISVIARSESDEAIQFTAQRKLDCFAALAMTESSFVIAREGGRSSIPETPAIDPRGRGVLDPPHARGMTIGG